MFGRCVTTPAMVLSRQSKTFDMRDRSSKRLYGYIPCAVTGARTALMLPFAVILLRELATLYVLAIVLWSVASFLDIVDGYLARKMDSATKIGAMMDLTADRIMICVALVSFAVLRAANAYLVILVLTRELLVDSIRAWRIASGHTAPHNMFGRLKMLCIVAAVLSALLGVADWLPRRAAMTVTDALLFVALIAGYGSVLLVWRVRDRHKLES